MKKFDRTLIPAAPGLSFEQELWSAGLQYIAGIDEAGRGALAGPVAAAAVVLPASPAIAALLKGVRDSKEMAPHEREYWAGRISALALACGVGFASNLEIDSLGIVPATRLAMQRAMDFLTVPAQHLLVDFLDLPDCPLPQTTLVKGDARVLSIAAASVLAKTSRDARLRELDLEYPGYGFAVHKGYGTAKHLAAIRFLGPSPAHRLSFAPIRVES
ncbi:MAG TPA: ribonuclease HII [Anaerolineales bacterium]